MGIDDPTQSANDCIAHDLIKELSHLRDGETAREEGIAKDATAIAYLGELTSG